jgi:hypothetical protein
MKKNDKNRKKNGESANILRRVKPLCFNLNKFLLIKNLTCKTYEDF